MLHYVAPGGMFLGLYMYVCTVPPALAAYTST